MEAVAETEIRAEKQAAEKTQTARQTDKQIIRQSAGNTANYANTVNTTTTVDINTQKNAPKPRAAKILKDIIKWTAAAAAVFFIAAVVLINVLFPFKYAGAVKQYSQAYGVDSRLVYAVIWTESKFDANAQSGAGALGLMQLMPSTAEWCAAQTGEEYSRQKLFNPEYNIKLGTYYLSYLIHKYGEADAITAYNAGEGNLLEWAGEIRFKETADYIKRVNFAKKIYEFKNK